MEAEPGFEEKMGKDPFSEISKILHVSFFRRFGRNRVRPKRENAPS